jgi:hypothetical protein
MARLKKEIPNDLKKHLDSALGDLHLASQIVPLMFDKDHMAILLSLKVSSEAGGLSFSQLGDVTKLGKSQKLVDFLGHLSGYGFIEKTNGNYELTDYGLSAAGFVVRFLDLVNQDPDIARSSPLAGHKAVIHSVNQRYAASIKNKVKQST